MLLFLERIVPQIETRRRTFAKGEVLQFHRHFTEKERMWFPISGAKQDSKIPKIQRGSVLDVGFSPSPHPYNLWHHLAEAPPQFCCGSPKEPLTVCTWIPLAKLHPVLGWRRKDEKRVEQRIKQQKSTAGAKGNRKMKTTEKWRN